MSECEEESESNEARMAFLPGSDSGMEFARYHKCVQNTPTSLFFRGLEAFGTNCRSSHAQSQAHIVSRTTHGLEPPSYRTHSSAETGQFGNLCETGRPVISQAEPES